jgi:hypothetical protein
VSLQLIGVGTRQCRVLRYINSGCIGMISIPVVSELILPIVRTRQCRVPTIHRGRDTALPWTLSCLSATGIDLI